MIVDAVLDLLQTAVVWLVSLLPVWELTLPDICGVINVNLGWIACWVDLDAWRNAFQTGFALQVGVFAFQRMLWLYRLMPFH